MLEIRIVIATQTREQEGALEQQSGFGQLVQDSLFLESSEFEALGNTKVSVRVKERGRE